MKENLKTWMEESPQERDSRWLQEMKEEAIEYYRERACDEEIIRDGKTILFVEDNYESFYYPINDVLVLEPKDYFNQEDELKDIVNVIALNEILKAVDPLLFFTIYQIKILKTPEEIESFEEELDRSINSENLGFHTYDRSDIVINWYQIIRGARAICEDTSQFFSTVVHEFYLTLFHELGHATLRDNGLDTSFSPLIEVDEMDEEDFDEEAVVESYANNLFKELDDTFDLFAPFNREWINAQF